ncbi:putative mitochondrial protein AtMg00240 [Nicotiana tabacum]|uniref:Mitochondrial protein AtMg00240 n=1 Tax=Nicotiana tabacum TaxID=4097 RepID=A0AC58T4Z9_TOBAC
MYMEIPQGLKVEITQLVCRLRKSLYGLKQASRQWYDKLIESSYSRGFRYSTNDYSLFYKKQGSSTKLRVEEGTLLSDRSYYRKLVGKLNFLTNTRLDIAYSIQHLSQFMQAPREPHMKAAIRVLRYLKNDPTLGIFLSNDPSYKVTAYCDSDWAECSDSRSFVNRDNSKIPPEFYKASEIRVSTINSNFLQEQNICEL